MNIEVPTAYNRLHPDSSDGDVFALHHPANAESVGGCGDPHLVGFNGQKFDFTGEDGAWYSLLSDGPCLRVNMRITVPLPDTPSISYITGVGVTLCDNVGDTHSIELTVQDPHNLATVCPDARMPCVADGAVSLVLDGESVTTPGQVL